VLLGVLGIVFLSAGLAATILTVGSSHRRMAVRQTNLEQAVYVAEGAVERAVRYLEANIASLGSSYSATGALGSGTYVYTIIKSNNSTYSISATATVNNVTRWVGLKRIYQPTYAKYALWSRVNGVIYFKSGEQFNGHVHADDKLYFTGDPVFFAPVTSGASTYGGSIADVTFHDGFDLNASEGSMADVDFNSSSSSSLKNIASVNGLVLQGHTTITFNGSSVRITNSRDGYSNYNYTPSAEGIIYVRTATSGSNSTKAGRVYLQGGTVAGRLTIVTEEDTYIRGHIDYATDPVSNPTSTDALGIISRDDVWVDTSAPNNLRIDAAIMATGQAGSDGSFGVINYYSGSPRGNLNVLGGIIQDVRGAVGTFSGSATVTGYAKNYSFDPRFLDNPPPYFPAVSGKLEYSNWQEGK
jgi:hypothetical protein